MSLATNAAHDSSSDECEVIESWDAKLRSSTVYRHSNSIFAARKYGSPTVVVMASLLGNFMTSPASLYFLPGSDDAQAFADIQKLYTAGDK